MSCKILVLSVFLAILVNLPGSTSNKSPPGYVGCFKDAWTRVMPTRLGTFATRQICIDGCKKRKLPYAGIQAGGICFCGNQYNKHGKANNCNQKCKKDTNCGGYLANAVYVIPAKTPPGYVGCFKDAWKRVMPTRLGTFANRQMCIDGCKKRNLPYAGIQAGGICFCGNQYNKHGKANNCNGNCKRDIECGGYLANSVFIVPPKTPQGYVGCFKDAWKRVMPTRLETFDNRQMCIDGCKKRKLPYAGIQAGGICFCGNQYNKHGKANNCNGNCKRDIECGGYLANSVFIVPPKTPPGYVGCFKDSWKRVMPVRLGTFATRQMCIDGCKKRNLPHAGIQAGGICFCGNQYNKHGKANNCNENCKRDIECGGYYANSVFIVPAKTPPGYVGCFKDAWKRVMPTRLGTFATRQMCIDGCKKRKLPFAGIQAGGICFCGNQYNKHGKANNCNGNCVRDIGCGGNLANSVYKVPVVPDKYVQPKGYLGCYKDNKSRVMPNYQGRVSNPSQCIDLCRKNGEPYAGLQNYRDCWCGKEYNKEGKGDGCNLPCKAGGICGGFLRNSVYKISAAPEKYIQPKGYLGCYKDSKSRVMPNYQGRVSNPSQCIDLCRKNGEPYAGLQNYRDCWCGKEYNKEGKGDGCNLPCKAGGICGGFLRNSVYKISVLSNLTESAINTKPPGYVGCFKDAWKRVLPVRLGTFTNRQICINGCKKRNLPYAGIQAGGICFCGHHYNKLGKANNCNMNCKHDIDCGGYLANAVYVVPAKTPPGYVGCFNDAWKRVMPTRLGTFATRQMCIDGCKKRNLPYAGIQAGGICFCGHHYNKHGHALKCNQSCKRDIGCGGYLANSVYKVPLPIDSGYKGCFRDRHKRVFKVRLGTFKNRQICIDGCKKRALPYAGIQAGGICFCGYVYNKYGRAKNCNMKCKHDTGCGGQWANAVYEVPGVFNHKS